MTLYTQPFLVLYADQKYSQSLIFRAGWKRTLSTVMGIRHIYVQATSSNNPLLDKETCRTPVIFPDIAIRP